MTIEEKLQERKEQAIGHVTGRAATQGNGKGFAHIIGNSKRIREIFGTVEKLADTDSTVLVLGESGTGKELFARSVHMHSPRRNKNFVVVNCGAIPEDLLESELFGHEKGSFTGAIRTRVGKFEMAHEGTIFLDEIGDMSPALQVKLLRILQQQEFVRVGSNQVIRTNVRVVAATNIDLEKAIKEKRFREDLYYRLNVIPIKLPPLRARKDDIALLVDHFIKRFNRSRNRGIAGVTPAAMKLLLEYEWPGNVRELENICERMVVIKGEGMIDVEDLPYQFISDANQDEQLYTDMLLVGAQEADLEPQAAAPAAATMDIPETGISLKEVVEEYEMGLIMQALEKTNWVKNKAAAMLGLNRTTLVEKLKKRGITR
ncbi:MAG: sigma-54-dependent Fis family transcriptional regulator [Nitrospinae bacterium]|nr:sigma-54-dependent Fis family transcriptional regulator [Nitrospinota bacterium]